MTARRNLVRTAAVALGAFLLTLVPCLAPSAQAADDAGLGAQVARGEYLAKLGDCAGCHTGAPKGDPPQPAAPFAGGLPMGSPFGTIWTSNITPDPVYGIGRYSYADFERAVREGVAPGGKRLYPAMPYPSFSKISDDDMHALYAYFMHGVKPVAQSVPKTQLPFPFSQRWGLAVWSEFFAPHARYEAREDRSAEWNRGAYLVQGLGHCGACHTPRGPAYEERGFNEGDPLYLTGGTNDNWFAPNLSGDPNSGLGRWTADDIATFLRYGHASVATAFGSMVEVVEDSGQYMSEEDRLAIATYLKSFVPRAPSGFASQERQAQQQTIEVLRTGSIEVPGAGLYSGMCARCHGIDGQGQPGKYPRLAGNPSVIAPEATSLIRLLLEGGRSPSTIGGPEPKRMPAFASKLTDTEIARALTFIRNSWGNVAAPVTSRDVRVLRGKLHR
jgi:mono/diheme cytochrome c family protein